MIHSAQPHIQLDRMRNCLWGQESRLLCPGTVHVVHRPLIKLPNALGIVAFSGAIVTSLFSGLLMATRFHLGPIQ